MNNDQQAEPAAKAINDNMELVYADGWGLVLATTEDGEFLARAALAAAHPTITTFAGLVALPDGTGIQDGYGTYEKVSGKWHRMSSPYDNWAPARPATVLYWGQA